MNFIIYHIWRTPWIWKLISQKLDNVHGQIDIWPQKNNFGWWFPKSFSQTGSKTYGWIDKISKSFRFIGTQSCYRTPREKEKILTSYFIHRKRKGYIHLQSIIKQYFRIRLNREMKRKDGKDYIMMRGRTKLLTIQREHIFRAPYVGYSHSAYLLHSK